MCLGNKCDMNDRRQVSKERGEQVKACTLKKRSTLEYLAVISFLFTMYLHRRKYVYHLNEIL